MSNQTDNTTDPTAVKEFIPSYHFMVTFNNTRKAEEYEKDRQLLDKATVAFRDVSGLNIELQTEEIRSGGENMMVYRLPKPCKYGTLKMSRALPGKKDMDELTKWAKEAIYDLNIRLRDVQVSLLNSEHESVRAWTFADTYPVKLSVSEMNATKNELAIETLELVYKYSRIDL